jgi:hypothetical protein
MMGAKEGMRRIAGEQAHVLDAKKNTADWMALQPRHRDSTTPL